MGVKTRADELINEARNHVYLAILALRQIEDRDVSGSGDYRPEFYEALSEILINLRRARRELGEP